jgi:hypothetical protein
VRIDKCSCFDDTLETTHVRGFIKDCENVVEVLLISATSRTQITLKKKIVEKAKEQKSMEIDFQQSKRNELIKTI